MSVDTQPPEGRLRDANKAGARATAEQVAADRPEPMSRRERRQTRRLFRWPQLRARKAAARAEADRIAGEAFGQSEQDGPAPDDAPVATEEAITQMADLVKPHLGAKSRPKPRKARSGYYFERTPGALSTTRQGEILNTALLAAPTDDEGIAIGMDRLSKSVVAHDPFTAYRKKIVTSPHVIVLGVIGVGKSSLIKTVYVLRPLILTRRRAFILDRKDEKGEGEYAQLTRRFGAEPYRFVIGEGGTTLSPLDPRILEVIGASGQLQLLAAMAARAGGHELDAWEAKALRLAYKTTLRQAETANRVPVLDGLVPLLGDMDLLPSDERELLSGSARERLHQAGITLRFSLEQTLEEELNGLFNGETSKDLNLESRLTTCDISQLPVDGPATAMVLATAHAWLLGTLRRDRGWGTNFIVEEGWDMMTGPIARHLNSTNMLARGLGVSTVGAMHHVAQAAGSPEGISLLREPQTVHLYQQDREEDVAACVSTYGLDPNSEESLRNLAPGNHLLKIGSRPEILVEHVRSPLEKELTNTDSAMLMQQVAA